MTSDFNLTETEKALFQHLKQKEKQPDWRNPQSFGMPNLNGMNPLFGNLNLPYSNPRNLIAMAVNQNGQQQNSAATSPFAPLINNSNVNNKMSSSGIFPTTVPNFPSFNGFVNNSATNNMSKQDEYELNLLISNQSTILVDRHGKNEARSQTQFADRALQYVIMAILYRLVVDLHHSRTDIFHQLWCHILFTTIHRLKRIGQVRVLAIQTNLATMELMAHFLKGNMIILHTIINHLVQLLHTSIYVKRNFFSFMYGIPVHLS